MLAKIIVRETYNHTIKVRGFVRAEGILQLINLILVYTTSGLVLLVGILTCSSQESNGVVSYCTMIFARMLVVAAVFVSGMSTLAHGETNLATSQFIEYNMQACSALYHSSACIVFENHDVLLTVQPSHVAMEI